MRFALCFAVCHQGYNNEQPEGAEHKQNPKEPADATPVFGFRFGNSLDKDIRAAAFRADNSDIVHW